MFAPGTLKYADLSDSGDLPLPVIIAIAVGGGFFIVIILSIITVYHRKSKEAQRKIKKMLVQLDMLESNVRNECKQGKYLIFWIFYINYCYIPKYLLKDLHEVYYFLNLEIQLQFLSFLNIEMAQVV